MDIERGDEIFKPTSSYQNGTAPPPAPRTLNPNYQSTSKQDESGNDKKILQLQSTVNEVTDVLRSNVNKVLDRGVAIDRLNERSELLTTRTNEFRIGARAVRRKFWWQNIRLMLILGVIAIVIIVFLICKYRILKDCRDSSAQP